MSRRANEEKSTAKEHEANSDLFCQPKNKDFLILIDKYVVFAASQGCKTIFGLNSLSKIFPNDWKLIYGIKRRIHFLIPKVRCLY